MDIFALIFIFIIGISAFSGYFIGVKLYRSLAKAENKAALVIGIITGIFSSLVIFAGIAFLFIININFHR